MSDYVPDSDRSLAAIAEALERIADAAEALVTHAARPPAPAPCPWHGPITLAAGEPPPLSTTWIGDAGSGGAHG